jgi:hypothetical protein
VLSIVNERREQKVHKFRLPSPALVIALVALLVALSGTAVAAGVVPLAKRALQADNARHAMAADKAKLAASSQTATHAVAADSAKRLSPAAAQAVVQQAAQLPGPASSAAGIVAVKSTPAGQLGPEHGQPFTISCDPGQKILAAGFSSDGPVINLVMSYPTGDASWTIGLANLSDSATANITLYATCIK